ncbi:hypothetical protein B0W47_16705 (plasmid) [Komagataeibacter nataicola]|uniref:Uncharacterized protein n=2 Tax=Komagataeibacter nataicola TaxID=265960 RepID=A0A9N7D0A6_9PROT|nr:hypothetical protein B0W47_16705 [Komagataeibacter nataicola]PYD66264.1 hypothetical protein CDI09_08945 [Komagataeibacter nataicola]GBR23460.1 hypothetical protein AA0616_2528 [Komagataeibacter nataicola NRIC 0616]
MCQKRLINDSKQLSFMDFVAGTTPFECDDAPVKAKKVTVRARGKRSGSVKRINKNQYDLLDFLSKMPVFQKKAKTEDVKEVKEPVQHVEPVKVQGEPVKNDVAVKEKEPMIKISEEKRSWNAMPVYRIQQLAKGGIKKVTYDTYRKTAAKEEEEIRLATEAFMKKNGVTRFPAMYAEGSTPDADTYNIMA